MARRSWDRSWIWSLSVIFTLVGCGSAPQRNSQVHVVKAGETLYSIARRYGLDYKELARDNGIGRDYQIHVGQQLKLSPGAKLTSTPQAIARKSSAPPPKFDKPLPKLNWVWPVPRASFVVAERPTGGWGMTIEGTAGDAVRAAAEGKVVYVGSGLLGYGQLIVIRHTEPFISAYGYTQRILVAEGDQVQAGQQIATLGMGPAQKNALYFEIRVDGRPVDPRLYLPAIAP